MSLTPQHWLFVLYGLVGGRVTAWEDKKREVRAPAALVTALFHLSHHVARAAQTSKRAGALTQERYRSPKRALRARFRRPVPFLLHETSPDGEWGELSPPVTPRSASNNY